MSERHPSTTTLAEYFEPSLYNRQELTFFLDHLGESPVAASFKGLPKHVTKAAVDDVLGRIYTFEEIKRVHHVAWSGIDDVKESILRYLAWMETCARARAQGGPQHLSTYAWDENGRGVKGGEGADGGTVLTAILPGNKRVRLGIRIGTPASTIDMGAGADFIPDFVTPVAVPTALVEDKTKGLIVCPVCDWTANYTPNRRPTYTAARGRMAKHLKQATNKQANHRRLYNSVFTSGRTAPIPVIRERTA